MDPDIGLGAKLTAGKVFSDNLAVVIDDTTKKITRSTGSFSTDGYVAGMYVFTSSATNPGPFTIKSVDTLYLELNETPVDETASLDIYGDYLVDGVQSIDGPSGERKAVSLTHLNSAFAKKRSGMLDYGDVSMEILRDTGDDGQQRLETLLASGEEETFHIVFPDESYTAFDGYVIKFGTKIGGHDAEISSSAAIVLSSAPVTTEA